MDYSPSEGIKTEPMSPDVVEILSETGTDDRLRKAVEDSMKKKTMSPLIKEELRSSILHRRHTQGQGDITYDEPKPRPKGVSVLNVWSLIA